MALRMLLPPSPLDEIVQQARERAQAVLDESSEAVRALIEPDFFDYLDDILQAHDDCPMLAAQLDEVAVEYRCVREVFCVYTCTSEVRFPTD